MNTTLAEKLSKKQPISVWIRDFIDSTNPKFEGKTKKERIAMALGAYYGAQKNEEYGAGFEGTDELRDKYIKDTPGQRIQQFKTEMNQQTYKTYQEFATQHQKMYPYHNKDQIQAAWETYSKYFEMEEAQNFVSKGIYTLDGKKIDGARSSKLFLQALDSDGFLHNLSWKEWSESDLKDTSSDNVKKQFVDRLAKEIKMFNKRIDLNTWLKGGNRSFTDTVNYIFKLDPNIKYVKVSGLKEDAVQEAVSINFIDDLLDAATKVQSKNKQLRHGQSIMIALKDMNSKLYSDVTGTDYDPFYNDKNIPALLKHLNPNWKFSDLEETVDFRTMKDANLKQWLKRNDTDDSVSAVFGAQILAAKKEAKRRGIDFNEGSEIQEDDNKMIKVTGIETDLDPAESQWKMAVAMQRENGVKLVASGYHEFSISGPFKKVRAAVIRHYGDANEAEQMHPQIKRSMSEDSVQESRDFKSFSRENLILWLQTNWTGKKVSPQFRQELDAAVREAQSRGLYKNIKIEPQKTDTVQEGINIRDYMATSEKSQFGGYRPHVVSKAGKTMYLGQASYNTPDEAKDHAEEYLKQYARGISYPRVPIKGTYGLKEEKESYDSWIIKPREGNGDGVKVQAPDETSAIEIALGRKPSQNEIDFFNFHYILIHEKTNVSTLRNMKIVELATKCYNSDLVKEYVEQHYEPKTSALEIKESFRSFVSNKTI
jgi:hypothetical protein